ncbi:MAG: hypothetical protein ACLP53_27480, partial [Isosphaeraceae bacterium]
EYTAYKQYPQIVIALKNQLHRLRKLGIAPIAAAGQFGAPLGASSSTTSGGTGTTGSSSSTTLTANNSAQNSAVGDNNGMSLPAVLNEVISVTGVYPFPYTESPSTTPTDTPTAVIPTQLGPVLVFGNALTIGGTASTSTTGATSNTSNTAGVAANVITYTAADTLMYANRITGAANRSPTTDFAAPAIDVPTFRRTFSLVNTSTGTSTSAAGDPNDHLTFSQVGTSMSSAIVTGAYSLVASALNYWISLNQANGVTSDAYLTTPVGVDSLNFGAHAIKNLSVYNNPDGINGILAYTAVPADDVNDAGSLSTPPLIPGSTSAPSYASVSVGNAIASIEGTIAIKYLLSHNDFPLIDANGDGIITAQELQNFTDTAASKGLAEAGAMAALLGGTATYAQPEAGLNNTVFNENPDQPATLQRRFNYFDYLANGQLQGGISISSFKMLANTLLPQPDAYVIVDRQRASANGFLVAPLAQRNFVELQHLLPKFMFVAASAIMKYRNFSPANFGVNRNERPGTALPFYSLFGGGSASVTTGTPVVETGTVNGQTFSVSMVPLLSASSSSTSTTTTTPTTPYVGPTPTTTSTTATTTSTTPVTATASTTLPSSSTTPSTTSSVAQAATAATTTSTTETAAQAVVAAVTQLANAQSASSNLPNNLVPAGTVTPVTQNTSTTSATTASTSTATASKATTAATTATATPAATASVASAAASTTTVTPTTTATPAAATSASPAAAAAANQKKAALLAAAQKAAAKEKNFWTNLWDSLK